MLPQVHGESAKDLDVLEQPFKPKPLGPLAQTRIERRHRGCDLRRDAAVRRFVAHGGGKLFDGGLVVHSHVVAVGLALALPMPPVQVAAVVDHPPLAAQEIGVADVSGFDGADAQLLARGLGEQQTVRPQDGRAGEGFIGDIEKLALALGQARVARDEKARERILLQQAEDLRVEMILVAVAGKDQQRLFGVERRQRAGVVRRVNVVEKGIKPVPLDEERAVGDERDLHGKNSFCSCAAIVAEKLRIGKGAAL